MIQRRLIDTNFVVRHLVGDQAEHAKTAGRVFDACDRGELVIIVLPAVLAECVFVLESFYERTRAEIASALGILVSSPGVEISERAIQLDALDRYRGTKLHFVDCVIAATAAAAKIPVATFDRGLHKFRDVRIDIA